MEDFSKEIIVYKLYDQTNNPTLGYLRAVAEKVSDSYISLNTKNFCASEKIFVTRDYEQIDNKYNDFELFKATVIESQYPSDDSRPERNCKYVTKASETSILKSRDLIEVIVSSLPDPNNMVIDISNISIPSTPYIYLNDEGTCYGPFKWEEDSEYQIILSKIDSPMPGRKLASGSIYSGRYEDLSQHVLYCPLGEGERFYFMDLLSLHNDTNLNAIDYSSDEEIVNTFVKIAKDINFNSNKVDLKYLEANVKKLPISRHKNLTDKLSKLKDITNRQILIRTEVIEGFGKFLRSELGQNITESYINKNKELYLTDIRNNYKNELEIEFREKQSELSKLKDKIESNKIELIDLGQQIEERKQININADMFDNLKENEGLDQDILRKKEQLSNLNEQITPLLEKYSKYSSLDEIENEFTRVKSDYDYEMRRKIEIEDQIRKLEAQYNENEDKLRAKLFEMKPFVDAINGNVGLSNREYFKNINQEINPLAVTSNTAQDILRYIEYSLKQEGRVFSILDIINVTVTLQQSFICFLAGLPGGGKTTLARLLAKIYGIQQQRFLDIPVARGWTGQKDLIGFFNPITNKFQSSSTGLYEFLYALSEESKAKDVEVPISLVLLDEANLSPMEHYWSSFMGLTDSKEDKELILGEEHIRIPENLRFVATINYDSTTEYLSPRLIDRAPIIVLESNTISTTSFNHELDEGFSLKMPISYDIMEQCFGKTEKIPEFVENEKRVYEKVKTVLEERDRELGKPIIISNRKEIAIRQYCNKARPLMREFSTDEELLALDYAVLQLILPLLRGHGKNFSKRLENLRNVLSDQELDRSVNYLDTIISYGNADLHTYDFFCW